MQEPLNIVTMVFYLDPKKKKTIYTGKLPKSKNNNKKIFLGFPKLDRHTKRKREKENKLTWMIQWQSVNIG